MHYHHPAGPRDRHDPSLRVLPSDSGRTRTVVLVLHGGRVSSEAPTRPWQLAYRRMIPFARAVHRATADRDTAVWLLRNRLRGWNEPHHHPLTDASRALERIGREHPSAHIVLLGHSMGGRVALRLAGADRVSAVCALAPWVEPDEPMRQLAGRRILVLHGDRDRRTSPHAAAEYVRAANQWHSDIRFVRITGDGHAMLRRPNTWNALVCRFAYEATASDEQRPEATEGDS